MSDLKKTCYIILNHNVRDVTTTYYEELEYYQEQDNFDLLLIDNGSRPSEKSVYTTHSFKKMFILMELFSGLFNICWTILNMII